MARAAFLQRASEPDIFFVTRKWAPATGGMETYSLRLTEALAEGAAVEVMALPGCPNGMPPGPFALLAFPLTVLARALRRPSAPQVLHLADMALWPLAALALGWRDTQVALSAHGTDVSYHRRGGFRGTFYRFYLTLGARLLRNAKVIANSRATAEVAAETGWRDAAIVPLGTDSAPADPVDGSHDNTILFVGRLVERKGCGWFIREVLPRLAEGTRLLVAGTAWDASERAALQAPGVEFLGAVHGPALTELYRQAKCVVVPNIDVPSGEYEGFGLVAPEAAAAGGLVLAARSGGLTDAVIDGITGLLVEPGNAEAWCDAIEAISAWDGEARRGFLTRAQAAVTEHFSWSRVARETAASYGTAA